MIISLILLLNAFVFLFVLGSKSESGTNYAIVLPYKTDSSDNFGYVWNGEKFVEKVSGNGVVTQVVYTPQGVTNGRMANKYFVNVLIDGEVQNACLAEYVHTHINTISLSDDFVTYSFSEDGKIVNTNIENIEVAETVMYN